MDVYDAIRSRVAVRSFKPDPVPDAALDKILRAARWSPSRRNRQPWRLIVIKNKDTLTKLAGLTSGGSYIADAPMAIAVVMDDKRMAQFDAGRLIENMLLVAWSEGIGTCMVGGWDQDAVKELLRNTGRDGVYHRHALRLPSRLRSLRQAPQARLRVRPHGTVLEAERPARSAGREVSSGFVPIQTCPLPVGMDCL